MQIFKGFFSHLIPTREKSAHIWTCVSFEANLCLYSAPSYPHDRQEKNLRGLNNLKEYFKLYFLVCTEVCSFICCLKKKKKEKSNLFQIDHKSSKDNISTMGELDSWGQGRVLESWEIGFLFGCPRNLGINILQSIILHKSFRKS